MPDYPIRTSSVTLNVAGSSMPCHVARPLAAGPRPGLIVFQEAFGVNAHIRDITERFGRAGYTAIAPALFHRTDRNFESGYGDFEAVRPHYSVIDEKTLAADATAAFEWLTPADGGGATVAGCIGYCLGGRASFVTASELPVKAAVSYYGGGIAQNHLDRAGKLNAPLLLFWGGLDKHIDSTQIRTIEDALIAAEKDYTQVVIAKADHGFFCDERPSYSPDASRLAWALTLEFLSARLSG